MTSKKTLNRVRVLPALFSLTLLGSSFSAAWASSWTGLAKKAPAPADNPTTPAKVELGKMLFFDPRISKTGTVSCNSCHNAMAGGDDSRPTSAGIEGKLGGRNSPTVWNAAYHSVQFWDGRANTLEDQAKGPMTNPIEMGMENHDLVMARLKKMPGYQQAFVKAFGKKGQKFEDVMTIEHAAQAIAAYERTLITPDAPVDAFMRGNKKAISESAARGWKLVQTVGCLGCHSGPHFSGPTQKIGDGNFQKFPVIADAELETKYGFSKDLGRFEVTKKDADKNLWRVPTWRNVSVTAPYFHNGSVMTLDEAVRVMAKTQLNRTLKDEEVKDIVAFLNTLTGKFPEQKMPRLPELAETTVVQ